MSNQITNGEGKPTSDFIMDGAREIISLTSGAIHLEKQIEALEANIKSNPSLAVDLSKTLVETICKTILKDRGIEIERKNPDLNFLLTKTLDSVRLVNQHIEDEAEVVKHLRSMSKGLVSAFQGLGELRNKKGFASHGHDGYMESLEPMQAMFAARAADALVHFLYQAHRNYEIKPHCTDGRTNYSANQEFNDYIDNLHEQSVIFGMQYTASEILAKVDPNAYLEYLTEFEKDKKERYKS